MKKLTDIQLGLNSSVETVSALRNDLIGLHGVACCDDNGKVNVLSILTRDLIDQTTQIKDRLVEIQSLMK